MRQQPCQSLHAQTAGGKEVIRDAGAATHVRGTVTAYLLSMMGDDGRIGARVRAQLGVEVGANVIRGAVGGKGEIVVI